MGPMLETFVARETTEEWMDQPETSEADFYEALEDIHWVNRYLNGAGALLQGLERLVSSARPESLKILDVGCGGGDLPKAMVRWGQKKGIAVSVDAVDLHPYAVARARENVRAYPGITVYQADAFALGYAEESVDIVTCSMCLHHFSDAKVVQALQDMYRLSRIGIVVNDLERHPVAYASIWLLGKLLNKGPVFQHDAPLSVKRGFSELDLARFKQESGLSELTWHRVWPYRFLLLCVKPAHAQRGG